VRADALIAITGAASEPGRGVRESIAEQSVPVERVRLLEKRSEEAIISEYAGQAVLIGALEPEQLVDRDLVFLCGSARETRLCLGWERKAGALFVDLAGEAAAQGVAPVVNVAVNPGRLIGAPATVAAPHPISFALTSALAPLERELGLVSVEATALRPVSDFGEPGIEELHRQTVGLLNFTEYPREVFGHQLAFNLLPQSLFDRAGDEPPLEARLAREVAGVFGWESARATVRAFVAPVFHGHALILHLRLGRPVDRREIAKLLAGAEGIAVSLNGVGAVSPVEAAGQEEIRIAEIAPDGVTEGGWWLWLFGGNIPAGAARNAVEIAGRLLVD